MVGILIIMYDFKKYISSAVDGCTPYSKYSQNKKDEKFIFKIKPLMFPS